MILARIRCITCHCSWQLALLALGGTWTLLESIKNLKRGNLLEIGAKSPASSAPGNDGRRSFSTKERLVVNAKRPQKGVVFLEKGAFSAFSR